MACRTLECFSRRPGPVFWKAAQFGKRAKLPLPVIQLMGQRTIGQCLVLGSRKVGVLSDRFQRCLSPVQIRLVMHPEFPVQDEVRPTVGNNVVQANQEHMPVGIQAEQAVANKRSPGKIETLPGLPVSAAQRRTFPVSFRYRCQIGGFQSPGFERIDDLYNTLIDNPEYRAKRRVAAPGFV